MKLFILATCLLGAVASSHPVRADEAATLAPASVPDFTLRDPAGNAFSFADLRGKNKLIAITFLGCDCPLVRLYVGRINELARDYQSQGVAFLAINSNLQDSASAVSQFIRAEKVSFPILLDPDSRVADQFKAERTPEAYLVDTKGKVLYRGRIDDQYGIGYQRPHAQRRFLADAIAASLKGATPEVARTAAVGCKIGRPSPVEPKGDITFNRQILRIFQKRCLECHREGEVAPFPVDNYVEARGWAPMIAEVIDQGRMPPWGADPRFGHFSNDPRMTDEEKKLIHAWIANGCPEGDAKDTPAAVSFAKGWRIGEPDVVYKIAEKPAAIPARGPIEYRHYYIPTGFNEDRWVVAGEPRPGNRKVVHHIAVWILPPGMPEDDFSMAPPFAYAPGMPPLIAPEGSAILLPKGSRLRFQIHYEPNGLPAEDLSDIGLKFVDPSAVKRHVVLDSIFPAKRIDIPPGEAEHRLVGKHYFARDALLFGLMPHMHIRGKAFRFDLISPDGKRETLLDVPRFDFNWQFWYFLSEKRRVPAGSILESVAVFDNSPDNPNNPDASKRVAFGPQTSDEMSVGYFAGVDPASEGRGPESYLPPREGFAAPVSTPWALDLHGAAAQAEQSDPASIYSVIRVDVTATGTGKAWEAHLWRVGVPLRKGLPYSLIFRARAATPRPISFGVSRGRPPFNDLGVYRTVKLFPEWGYHRVDFEAKDDDDSPRIRFDLGAATGQVELNDVVLLQGYHR